MFRAFWGTPEQQDVQTPSWYQPAAGFSPSPSIPSTPNTVSSMSTVQQRPPDHSPSPSYGQVSPAEAAAIIGLLKDKSVDELRKILNDKEAYNALLNSIEQVKIQNNLRDELLKETIQLARENLEKEPRILELRNQCRIIRTTELAAAQEKLNDLEKEKEETLRLYAPATLVRRLEVAIGSADQESEKLHEQFLSGEMDLQTFLNAYKKQRMIYHRRSLLHLAAKTSL